jgi:hypothetical protein
MPGTTLKLPSELKDRVKAVAEKRKEFVAAALAARRNFQRTRRAHAFEDMRDYFMARAAGKPARKPRLKRWRA